MREEVMINGMYYVFSNEIGQDKALFSGFNKMAKKHFGISFDTVGGDYEPHVLIHEGEVCANVSVNQIYFQLTNGKQTEKKLMIQLGTVMTNAHHRGKGLSGWLMEWIIKKWENQCDMIYLFANDSVLEFYPKFGFHQVKEYEYYLKVNDLSRQQEKVTIQEPPHTGIGALVKLSMDKIQDVARVKAKYQEGNPFSKLYMRENEPIFSFYFLGFMKEQVYYSARYDAVVMLEQDGERIYCQEIYGARGARLEEILAEMLTTECQEIVLGFTPLETAGYECRLHQEEDTTLFVYQNDMTLFQAEKMMFPVTTHA